MKKEYLIELVEKGYEGGEAYNRFIDVFIDQLRNDNNFQLANEIKEIKNSKIKITKPNANKTNNLKNLTYPENILNSIENIKIGYKKGIINKILLKGKPGTGKTMFVELLANKLKLNLINIKLSDIMDFKYGESIKKIDNIMAAYMDIPCIIFFDEADSLFSNRFLKNDLLETSRILTTMLKILDQNTNAIICFATNLFKNLDKAFVRRMDLILDFNKYTKETYEKILNNLDFQYDLGLNEKQKNIILNKISNDESFSPAYLKNLAKWIAINNISKANKVENIIENFFEEHVNE